MVWGSRAIAVLLVASASGCSQLLGLHDLPADAPVGDGTTADVPPSDGGLMCFGTAGTDQICVALPTGALTLATAIDTDTSPACGAYTSDPMIPACVLAGTTISVTGAVRATGTRALVLASTTSITIANNALLDVASHRTTGSLGAGADPAACVAGTLPTSQAGIGGGGYGGSFAGFGGNGGTGNGGAGGQGGRPAAALTLPSPLRGGCPGSDGASGMTGAGATGHGGGAVALLSRGTITIDGEIDASGSGGGGGGHSAGGGGGGGSGGMIVLDAMSITMSAAALVFANGGGGGEGGDVQSGGAPGADPSSPSVAALGGNGGTASGGNGGAGSARPNATGGDAGNGGSSAAGGGGGGGAGYLHVVGSFAGGTTMTVSPAPR